jgi:uncharacterized RDD family membrane protein YckC
VPPELASRGARLLAASLDELILLAIGLPLVFGAVPVVMDKVGAGEIPDVDDVLNAMVGGTGTIVTVVALIVWCVITTWLVASNGQSIGKRLVGIKVVRTNGERASLARIFLLRNLVNGLPLVVLPYVGLLYQLIDPLLIYQPAQQCIHDKIADTIVVRS